MIACNSIIFNSNGTEHEVLVSPLMLQSKEEPNMNFGRIVKLFFYENWRDEEYISNLKHELIKYKTDDYLINYGQDFGKYYIGYLNANFDTKSCWGWQSHKENITEQEAKILEGLLFDPNAKFRKITIFTPTRPSYFNLTKN